MHLALKTIFFDFCSTSFGWGSAKEIAAFCASAPKYFLGQMHFVAFQQRQTLKELNEPL